MTLRLTSSSVAAPLLHKDLHLRFAGARGQLGPLKQLRVYTWGADRGSFARDAFAAGLQGFIETLPRLRLEGRRLLSDWDGGGGVPKLKSRGSCTAVPHMVTGFR